MKKEARKAVIRPFLQGKEPRMCPILASRKMWLDKSLVTLGRGSGAKRLKMWKGSCEKE